MYYLYLNQNQGVSFYFKIRHPANMARRRDAVPIVYIGRIKSFMYRAANSTAGRHVGEECRTKEKAETEPH